MVEAEVDRLAVGTGAGAALTVIVTLSLALPPSPLQLMLYVVVDPGLTDCEPLLALLPVQLAEQLLASVEFQLNIAD